MSPGDTMDRRHRSQPQGQGLLGRASDGVTASWDSKEGGQLRLGSRGLPRAATVAGALLGFAGKKIGKGVR